MNYKVGTDIIKNSRMTADIAKRILVSGEIERFNAISDENEKMIFAASRWAAKEAVVKASDKKIIFSEIEVFNSDTGRPFVKINGETANNIDISISHENDYSLAFCIIKESII